ncbi:hypothetical protein ACHQM5_019905 [Ranunculus cassubicifolius]
MSSKHNSCLLPSFILLAMLLSVADVTNAGRPLPTEKKGTSVKQSKCITPIYFHGYHMATPSYTGGGVTTTPPTYSGGGDDTTLPPYSGGGGDDTTSPPDLGGGGSGSSGGDSTTPSSPRYVPGLDDTIIPNPGVEIPIPQAQHVLVAGHP